MYRRMKGTVFLIIICLQFILLGSSAMGTNFLDNNELDETNNSLSQNVSQQHF